MGKGALIKAALYTCFVAKKITPAWKNYTAASWDGCYKYKLGGWPF